MMRMSQMETLPILSMMITCANEPTHKMSKNYWACQKINHKYTNFPRSTKRAL